MPSTPTASTGVDFELVRGVSSAQFGDPVSGDQVELAEGETFTLDDARLAAVLDAHPFLKRKGKAKTEPEEAA